MSSSNAARAKRKAKYTEALKTAGPIRYYVYISVGLPVDSVKLSKVTLPPGWTKHHHGNGGCRFGFYCATPPQQEDADRVLALLQLCSKRGS